MTNSMGFIFNFDVTVSFLILFLLLISSLLFFLDDIQMLFLYGLSKLQFFLEVSFQ
jgi:hypothetical protein